MELSIIIVTYNTEETIADCLDSIPQGVGQGMNYEVVIVDNGSADATLEVARRSLPNARIIPNGTNLGYAGAVNRGLNLARGRFLLISNSDVKFPRSSIRNLVAACSTLRVPFVVSPQLVYPNGAWQRSGGPTPSIFRALMDLVCIGGLEVRLERAILFRLPRIFEWKRMGYVDGAVMLVPRQTLDLVGEFDERFFFYGEDVDLCHRVRQAGGEVLLYRPVRVYHLRGASSVAKGSRAKWDLLCAEAEVRFVQKHFGARYALGYLVIRLLYFGIRFVVWSTLSKFFSRLQRRATDYEVRLRNLLQLSRTVRQTQDG